MKQVVYLVFYARFVVQNVLVKVAEFQHIPFQSKTVEQYSNIRFYQSGALKGDKDLEALNKKHYILIIYIFLNWDYLVLLMCFINMKV